MRTKTLLVAAVLGAVSLTATMAQVASVNAVGYVNKELGTGYSLITNPLSMGNNMLSEVIPTAPDGAQVIVFRDGAYDTSTYIAAANIGWTPDRAVPVGEGFFFNNPGDAVTVTFVGEVLQGADTNKMVPAGLSIQGSLVPQAGALGADLMFPAGTGDTAYTWNGSAWDSASFVTGLGWLPADPMVGVGDAVFLDKSEGGMWNRDFMIQ